jgi:bile acid:Na+ symporter, BASS family
MNILSLTGLAITISVFLGVLAVGMRVAPADLQCVLRTPSRLVRSLRLVIITVQAA